jgi:hypothetical protein
MKKVITTCIIGALIIILLTGCNGKETTDIENYNKAIIYGFGNGVTLNCNIDTIEEIDSNYKISCMNGKNYLVNKANVLLERVDSDE